MSRKSKKDLRNGRESGAWRPHQWNEQRRAIFTKHVTAHALRAVREGKNEFSGAAAELELRTILESNFSAHKLHDLGLKTLGET